jgi:hypothetical protein
MPRGGRRGRFAIAICGCDGFEYVRRAAREAHLTDHTKGRVERELGQEQLAEALSCIVDGRDCPPQIAGAGGADKPVSQILPSKKDEDDEITTMPVVSNG